jgi:hypothetical protein
VSYLVTCDPEVDHHSNSTEQTLVAASSGSTAEQLIRICFISRSMVDAPAIVKGRGNLVDFVVVPVLLCGLQ